MWRVASIFFREPTRRHYLKGISRSLKLAHTSVQRELDQLLYLGLIERTVERRGTRSFPLFRAKIDGELYLHYKRLYNFDSLRGLTVFLRDKLMPKAIVLFGSYRRGDDTERSDIDLFVQVEAIKLDLSLYEKRLGRKINIYDRKDFKKIPEELKRNIINGIVLHGYLD